MTDEATDTKPIKEVRRMVAAEYFFSFDEKLDLSNELAEKIGEVENLESKKKNLTDQMKNEIGVVEARIADLGRKVRSGSEYREFFCRCEFDWPNNTKNWHDIQTGELRKSEPITAEDLQMKIRFEEFGKEDEEAPTPKPNGTGKPKQKALPESVEDASFTVVEEGNNDE